MSEPLDLQASVEASTLAAQLLEATLPTARAHTEGDLRRFQALAAEHPDAFGDNIWLAAASGDAAAVRQFLADDPSLANRRGGTRHWEPLLYLCYSRVLRHDLERREALHDCARALLDGGASATVSWFDPAEGPEGNYETAIYGAAGVANDPVLTAMLLEAGADPNDNETAYHCVEHDGVPCAEVLWPHFDAMNRGTALLHKLDYPDLAGLRTLLELGADPNGPSPFPKQALHQAVFRGHPPEFFELLFEHGADPLIADGNGRTPYAIAARSGRRELMELLERHGGKSDLAPTDAFLAACAAGDGETARALLDATPSLLADMSDADRAEICEAADAGNLAGVETMLDLGWDVNTRGRIWAETPLHRAAMTGNTAVARLLYERGADLTIRDCSYDASPIGWGLHGGHPDLVAQLAADPSRLDMRDAFECGCTERALELLGNDDPNAAVLGGDPGVLLRAAAASGNLELVEGLLARGADPALRNREGENARDVAIARDHAEIVARLGAL